MGYVGRTDAEMEKAFELDGVLLKPQRPYLFSIPCAAAAGQEMVTITSTPEAASNGREYYQEFCTMEIY